MSVTIQEPNDSPNWLVWLDTEPGGGNEICAGAGSTRALAIADAIEWLACNIGALIELRKVED